MSLNLVQTESRITSYSAVATQLALLSDQRLSELLSKATPKGTSIGGTTLTLEVSGLPIFVKVIRLTDIERRPENRMSTANVFGLPPYCQYGIGTGIGSPGFGVWRELAVHTMTTNWVLSGECPNFPIMYHWRVLPKPTPGLPTAANLKEVDSSVEYWEHSSAVRTRLEENRKASASVVLFLEHIPMPLDQWLNAQLSIGGAPAESATAMVERELQLTTSFMNARDLLHFDAHFRNIMTDGHHLYFSDFGLAISKHFELSKLESDFFANHLNYDRCYTTAHLANFLAGSIFGMANRETVIQEYARGSGKWALPPQLGALLKRTAPVALVMNEFFRKFLSETRLSKYPTIDLERALSHEYS